MSMQTPGQAQKLPPVSITGRHMTPAEWSMLALLSVLWAGGFFFTAVAVRELPPFTVVASRLLLAAVFLNLFLFATGRRMPAGVEVWGIFLLMGALTNAVPFSLIAWGQTQIPGGLAAILNASTPVWTLILAHYLVHDEKMTVPRVAGIAVAFAGVVYMVGTDALNALGAKVAAQVAVLGAAVSYSFAGVLGRRFYRLGISPILFTTGQMTAAAALMIPIALLSDRPWQLPMPGPETIGAVIAMALLANSFAYILFYRILATVGAVNVAMVTMLIPVTTVFLGMAILDEQILPKHFAGMICIATGIAVIDGRVLRLFRKPA
jgi:drug/metabolite transporter (DMT)-like permease